MANITFPVSIKFADKNGNMESKIIVTENELICEPNIKACMNCVFRFMFLGEWNDLPVFVTSSSFTVTVGKLLLQRTTNDFIIKWEDNEVPPSFYEFKKEFERYYALKAFW